MTTPSLRKKLAKWAVMNKEISIRLACEIFRISQCCYCYENRLNTENAKIEEKLLALTRDNPRWGVLKCHQRLRLEGFRWGFQRVRRIYRAVELNLRIKPRRRLKREKPEKLEVPDEPNEVFSLDFMHDQLSDGRPYRTLNVIDDCTREGLAVVPAISFTAERVCREMDRVIEQYGKPKVIRCDNGPEIAGHAFQNWARDRGIRIEYIQPGKPQQNAYVERFNRTVRYELLEMHDFKSIDEVQAEATKWLWTYNNYRPNMAIGGITPAMKLQEATG